MAPPAIQLCYLLSCPLTLGSSILFPLSFIFTLLSCFLVEAGRIELPSETATRPVSTCLVRAFDLILEELHGPPPSGTSLMNLTPVPQT